MGLALGLGLVGCGDDGAEGEVEIPPVEAPEIAETVDPGPGEGGEGGEN